MTIGLQVLIFGMTGLLIYVGVYYIVPKQIKRGKSSLVSFFASLWLPVFLLTPFAQHSSSGVVAVCDFRRGQSDARADHDEIQVHGDNGCGLVLGLGRSYRHCCCRSASGTHRKEVCEGQSVGTA